MRLGFVIHQFFPRHHTGTEQYALALAREARRRGHEVFIFTFEPHADGAAFRAAGGDEPYDEIPVRRIAAPTLDISNPVLAEFDSPIREVQFRAWLDQVKPDLIHFFHWLNIGIGCAAEAIARGIPSIAHATDFFTICPIATLTLPGGAACDGPPDGGLGCFQCIHSGVGGAIRDSGLSEEVKKIAVNTTNRHLHRKLLPAMSLALAGRKERMIAVLSKLTKTAAPSRFLYNTLVKHGFPESKLARIPYGIDPSRLANLKANNSVEVTFGYFGTIAPHKGLLQLVEAFLTTKTNAKLIIRGKMQEFPEYAERIVKLIGANPSVNMHRVNIKEPFGPAELGLALSEIDCLAVPSLWHENTPFVALEALAAGRPVIGSARGGLAEVVASSGERALFEPSDINSIGRVLTEFSDRNTIDRARASLPKPRYISEAFQDFENLLLQCAAASNC
ncbi:MAG: glycosyltransferase [Planctomycetota bacterium]